MAAEAAQAVPAAPEAPTVVIVEAAARPRPRRCGGGCAVCSAGREVGAIPGQPTGATGVWRTLDERERACLVAAYAVDREQERAAREVWLARRWRPSPDTWRWLPCAPDWPLHAHLERVGLLDAGTAATFAALERRRLLTCRYDETALGTTLLVRLTRLGRAVAREGAG